MQDNDESTALHYPLLYASMETVKLLIREIESSLLLLNSTTIESTRNRKQAAIRTLTQEYEQITDDQIADLVKATIIKLFAFTIYNADYVPLINEADIALLNQQIVALLDKDNTVSVPLLIQDYFKVLTKSGQLSDSDNNADFATKKYFATPWGLHVNLTSKELNKTIFRPETNVTKRMKNNLLEAKQKGYFADL